MFFLTLALLSAPSTCTEIKQQCRACPTAPNVKGCSTVGIACQPTRPSEVRRAGGPGG
jgi:hypothetical protein